MPITKSQTYADADLLAMPQIAALIEKARFETGIAERMRIVNIMGLPEAQNRPKLAMHLATRTTLAPDIAASTLKLSPRENSAGNDYLAAALAGDIAVQGFDPSKSGGAVDPKAARLEELKAGGAEYRAARAAGRI